MRKYLIIPVFTAIALFGLSSCPDNTSSDISKIDPPDSNVSYVDHVKPILAANCGLSNCHGVLCGENAYPMYDYYTLVESTYNLGVVWKGNPDASRLVEIIEYKGNYHYPYYTWNINKDQKQGIRQWIKEGAKNN